MTITFANPPINEVVLGQTFHPRHDLLVPYIGEFWTLMKGQYPKCSHAAPIIASGTTPTFDFETSVPRVWLISEDETRLIQVQQDRFYFNWRQTKVREDYIRFGSIKTEFDRVFGEFARYVASRTGQALKAERYELNYINILDCGQGWEFPADIGNVLRDLCWTQGQRFLSSPKRVSAKFEFALPEGFGVMTAALDPARTAESRREVFRLELAAAADADVVARVSFDEWVAVAHEWIVSGFKDLTTPTMHTDHWNLER